MPTPSNPSFEIQGATAGLAQDWNLMWSSTGDIYTNFSGGAPPNDPIEDYEDGWDNDDFVTEVPPPGTPTQFDEDVTAGVVESYDFWPNNQHYHTQVTVSFDTDFDAGASHSESYDTWDGNEDYLVELGPGDLGSPSTENYETGWLNDTYATTFIGGTLTTFRQGAQAFESYEFVQWDVIFTIADPASDFLVTATPHGLADDFKVTVLTTGTRPAGLVENQVYFLRDTGTFQFKLALSIAGPAVNITDFGIGTHSIHADETLYWTQTE